MPDLPQALVKFAAELVKHQAKQLLGEGALDVLADSVTDLAGDETTEKINAFVTQGENARKLLDAFESADECFAQSCDDGTLRQAIKSQPLRGLDALAKLAAAIPKTLDDAGLVKGLREQFANDWRGQLTDAQLDHAASVYRDCLSNALAIKCEQLGVWTLLEVKAARRELHQVGGDVQQLRTGQQEIKSILINLSNLAQLGPRGWTRPSPPRPHDKMIGRQKEFDEVRQLLVPGARAAITAMHGMPGVGKTLLAEVLASDERLGYDAELPSIRFQLDDAGFNAAWTTGKQMTLVQAVAYAVGESNV